MPYWISSIYSLIQVSQVPCSGRDDQRANLLIVNTRASHTQLQGTQFGQTEICKDTRRGDQDDYNLAIGTTEELILQIEESVDCLNRISCKIIIFCQTLKYHELNNPWRSARADAQSIISRVRKATEQHIDHKLPRVSGPLYSALVAANVCRAKHLLYTNTARSLSNNKNTTWTPDRKNTYLEPWICVSDMCCDKSDDEVLTFSSTNDWIAHLSSATHTPRWACSQDHDYDKRPMFDDVEAFKRHVQVTHGTEEEADMDSRVERALFAGANIMLQKQLITDCIFCDEYEGDLDGYAFLIFENQALKNHIQEHLLEVAEVLWREAGNVLLFSGKDQGYTYEDDIRAKAPANSEDRRHRNILHHACLYGTTELFSALMYKHDALYPLIRQPDAKGQTALHYAARYNSVASIRVLVGDSTKPPTAAQRAERLDLLQMRDDNGFSPFLVAVMHGSYAAARAMLVDFDAPVNTVDEYFGASALTWAASRGHVLLTELLLQHGADVESPASNGLIPLHEAAARGHDAIVRMMLDKMDGNVDYRSSRGFTALHLAAGGGHVATVKLLLQHKASTNATSIDGISPLHCAANARVVVDRTGAAPGDYVVIVELLLQHNASAIAATTNGVSPLHCAANAGHTQIVRKLLLESVTPTLMEATTNRWTPLHFAAAAGHTDVVKQLLAANASTINIYDARGWSVLDLASYHNHWSTFKILLGVPNIADVCGGGRTRVSHPHAAPSLLLQAPMTALQIAAAANNVSLATFLLASISAVNETNFTHQTALYYAVCAGHADMVALLLRAPHTADIHIIPPGVPSWKHVIASDTTIFNLIREVGPIGRSPPEALDDAINIWNARQKRGLKDVPQQGVEEKEFFAE